VDRTPAAAGDIAPELSTRFPCDRLATQGGRCDSVFGFAGNGRGESARPSWSDRTVRTADSLPALPEFAGLDDGEARAAVLGARLVPAQPAQQIAHNAATESAFDARLDVIARSKALLISR